MDFDYKGAIDAGYSEDEIVDYLAEKKPDFDIKGAKEAGYTSEEIFSHLSPKEAEEVKEEPKEELSFLQKAGRLISQVALGAAQGSPLGIVYDVSTLPAGTEAGQLISYRNAVFSEIEDLAEKKAWGEWNDKDQELLDHLTDQVKHPWKMRENMNKPIDISIRGLAEKATGADLHPHGIAEKAANWIGFIKDPKNLKNIFSWGTTPKEITKAILPTAQETFRGIGAGAALEMAEEGQFGPVGTVASMIVGDILGHAPTAIGKAVANPKSTAAKAVNLLTMNNTKTQAAQQIAEDFAKSGLTVDAGTLTGSPLIQMLQARLSQSGLTGSALENFRKELSGQIVREYENVLADVGELTFENNHQAAEAIKEALKVEEQALNIPKDQQASAKSIQGEKIPEDLTKANEKLLNDIAPESNQSTYSKGKELKETATLIKDDLKKEFNERYTEINQELEGIEAGPQLQLANDLQNFNKSHEGSLLRGMSPAEAGVLKASNKLLRKLMTKEGEYIGVTLDELIKTKRTLADIADWEFHGSDYRSAYKKLTGDVEAAIDRALMEESPELRAKVLALNADYSAFKNTFENDNVKHLFEPKNQNYNSLYREFESNPDKMRSLEEVMGKVPEGKDLVEKLKRDYTQKVIEKPNLSAQQIKDLQSVLGPKYDPEVLDFMLARQKRAETNRVKKGTPEQELPVRPSAPGKAAKPIEPSRASLTGVERSRQGLRKKLYEELKGKDENQIMKQMDTIGGIKKLRETLNTTPEGKELFKELSRYKLAQLIDNKMKDAVTDQVKLGTFSGLLKPSKNKELVRELIGKPQYEKLEALQKNAGALNESAAKFFNASKSGTTVADVGLVATAVTGVLTGNPFMAVPALTSIGGSYVIANLLADPVFLRELTTAIKTSNPKKFEAAMKAMAPLVGKAVQKQIERNEEE